ncbi:hypothetical protein H483_0111535 [Dietzia sp. UCD-THP]|uniref:hypothetical protein n=1 Tax=Dietzia sp. UCD-THP TaxID=1292020 RepID=UPI0003635BA4|nr:hypothetical protein [Dietzia sp. UCD-THP]EYT62058.1 hypothetical protein H483_0111535 [Dietzia sp. UCD-THP]
MRTTMLAAASSALMTAALVVGAGSAAAAPDEPTEPFCVWIQTQNGLRCMSVDPATIDALGSLGYGSFGTGSLMDLLSTIINTGSVVLSVDVPNSTGSYAPGSLGSYGPEASIGELAVGSIGSIAGAS